jgi:hypothetical protein
MWFRLALARADGNHATSPDALSDPVDWQVKNATERTAARSRLAIATSVSSSSGIGASPSNAPVTG